MLSHPLLAENSLFKVIGEIFHPLFELFGWILAGLYAVWPNYGFAIAGLTVLIMLALTPVTVKSTKSMLAMQRLQPEMKKLQAKYKGPENREMLNQEMMRLYKENGTSPFGACLPMFLQMPFLIVLYDLIRGLSNTVTLKNGTIIGAPRYVPTNSQIHQSLVLNKGQMHWWFGMDLSKAPWPFSSHGFPGILPYLGLIAAAMILQYYQMRQMNSRNPQAAAANPQMQTMQKIFPFVFGLIYLRIPAGATIYMVVSSAMRVGTQELMFKTGMVTPVTAEREIGPVKEEKEPPPPEPQKRRSTATDGTAQGVGTVPPAKAPGAGGGTTNGKGASNGRKPTAKRPSNGKAAPEEAPAAKPHPRSRSKRTRKAR